MPGIRIAYTRGGSAQSPPPPAVSDGCRGRVLGVLGQQVSVDDPLIGDAEKPEWYPVATVDHAGATIALEGYVYGKGRTDLWARLEALASAAPVDDRELASRMREFAAKADGDFVIVWYEREAKRLCVIGDRFARLPLYYRLMEDRALIARDQRAVISGLSIPQVDPLGLAQLLLFGYPLGSRTVIAGVHRLLPGDVLVASPRGCQIVAAPISPWAGAPGVGPRTISHAANELRDAFVAACHDRCLAGHTDVLSLSGGMDSRTVAAGMRSGFGTFSSVTFFAPGSPHADERDCAQTVARIAGSAWQAYELDPVDWRCMRDIIRLKYGLSPIDLSFGLEYVRRIQNDFSGPVSLWTGEGGDKIFCHHAAIPRRPSPDRLVRFIIEKNAVWSLADVVALTGVHADDLNGSIHAAAACPGIELEDAYMHFLLSQRVVRWHFEGEDRHRTRTWPVAPAYAPEVVAIARAIPSGFKAGRRLYRAFLQSLAPDIAAIPLPGGLPAPGSWRHAAKHIVRDRLRNNRTAFAAYRWFRGRRRPAVVSAGPWQSELNYYREDRHVPSPVDSSELRRVISAEAGRPTNALPLLLTALWTIEALSGDTAGPHR